MDAVYYICLFCDAERFNGNFVNACLMYFITHTDSQSALIHSATFQDCVSIAKATSVYSLGTGCTPLLENVD